MATFFIDGNTLSNSSAIYLDPTLSICAPDGFYSDGTISREQVGCFLLPEQFCPACAVPCGTVLDIIDTPAFYRADFNVDSGGDTGAIIVKYNPQSVPDGIAAIFDGVTYNQLSSPFDGYHASTNPSGLTYIGDTAFNCGISGNTYLLDEYLLTLGVFAPSGNQVSVTVAAGDVSLSAFNPGLCVMVIPKTNPAQTILSIAIASPCSTPSPTASLEVGCPIELTGFGASNSYLDSASACASPTLPNTYYNVPVTGAFGVPALYDWVFSDINGEFVLTDGYYKTPAGWIHVIDGIVVSTGVCP